VPGAATVRAWAAMESVMDWVVFTLTTRMRIGLVFRVGGGRAAGQCTLGMAIGSPETSR
jgi:hypothetical protein